MDRHHLLSLLDKIQEKYEIQDGEYKEFAEAIGGKKKLLEFKEGDLVKVNYNQIETEVDFFDDEFHPKMTIIKTCSLIWKVIPNEHRFHGGNTICGNTISNVYLNKCDIHIDAMNKIVKDHSEGNFTMMSVNSNTQRKSCIRVSDIEII
jgi:hypothetical protein